VDRFGGCLRVVLLLLVIGFAASLFAAPALASPPDPSAEANAATTSEPASELDERGYVKVAEPSETALRYYRSGNWLWLLNQLWTLLIPALIVVTGSSARLRDWATKLGRERWRATLLFLLAYLALTFALDLPLVYYGAR